MPAALSRLLAQPGRSERVLHVEDVPARDGTTTDWPGWADPGVVSAWQRAGVSAPWVHQVAAADAAWHGRHVAVATGTASGKSLCYLLPGLTMIRKPPTPPALRGAGVLYLSPTKALAADQLQLVTALGLDGVRAAAYDGDTAVEERRWVRDHANLVLTNPDLLHHSLLPGHERWAPFLRGLGLVVVDECHHYRGVFGSHVAAVLRRLRRVAAHYGADPVFILASATAADPATTARQLTGLDVEAVIEDASPRGRVSFVLWEPPLVAGGGENGAPSRRSALTETSDLLADLVAHGVRTLAFVPSRRGVEVVAAATRRRLEARSARADPEPADAATGPLADRVAAYRGGYLAEDRRALEADLRSGRLLALATTSALELGVDISGLDAVLICGWPGRRASLWQQAGRAGRTGGDALAVLVARDDPLDTYVVHHPEAVFGRPVEATVLDPDNPYVLAPHLCAAAAELPLRPEDLPLFGETTQALVRTLCLRGALRERPTGWFWTRPERAGDLADLRGTGGDPVRVVEEATGRLIGTVDSAASHHSVHGGAIYLHQGRSWLVLDLSLDDGVALVAQTGDEVSTQARQVVDIRLVQTRRRAAWGVAELSFGMVDVSQRVVSYLRRDVATSRILGEHPLDLPVRTLRTAAVWWTVPEPALVDGGLAAVDIPGAAHAAEHAAIGLLPLVATCDRWDVGGVSTAMHPDTGMPTIVVHDGHPGGAGFAERGFAAAGTWLRATRGLIDDCECDSGCPACVQSPKCGNHNEPLDKLGAARLLDVVTADAPLP